MDGCGDVNCQHCGSVLQSPSTTKHKKNCRVAIFGETCECGAENAPKEKILEEFDKLQVEYHPFGVEPFSEPLLLDEEHEKVIKDFISSALSEQKEDYEILVNTILDTKNREISEQKENTKREIVEKIKKYDRFKCGACDGVKVGHTQFCQFRNDIINNI